MKILREIELFSREDEYYVTGYELPLTAEKIIEIIPDLNYEDDFDLYRNYDLTIEQVLRLKPYLKEDISINDKEFYYELGCSEI